MSTSFLIIAIIGTIYQLGGMHTVVKAAKFKLAYNQATHGSFFCWYLGFSIVTAVVTSLWWFPMTQPFWLAFNLILMGVGFHKVINSHRQASK